MFHFESRLTPGGFALAPLHGWLPVSFHCSSAKLFLTHTLMATQDDNVKIPERNYGTHYKRETGN